MRNGVSSSGKIASAFTLVELLVVIGIIALLISILLPALSSARKAAGAVKCSASLREVGNALQMYALEYRGWYPPAQLVPAPGVKYNLDGVDYPSGGYGAYWFNFLTKYVTRSKMGQTSTTVLEASEGRKTVFWACPEFAGYARAADFTGVSRVQPGYGMNLTPTFNPGYPIGPNPPGNENSFIQEWAGGGESPYGKFFKQKVWTRNGASRIVIADGIFWAIESKYLPPGPGGKPAFPAQPIEANANITTANHTSISVYRHGKYPRVNGNTYAANGGKVAFNCLFADGHVSTENTQETAYRGIRFRCPG